MGKGRDDKEHGLKSVARAHTHLSLSFPASVTYTHLLERNNPLRASRSIFLVLPTSAKILFSLHNKDSDRLTTRSLTCIATPVREVEIKQAGGKKKIRIFSNSLLFSVWPGKWNLSPPWGLEIGEEWSGTAMDTQAGRTKPITSHTWSFWLYTP